VQVEAEIFENHSAFLIGNQAVDFFKQDGVTEIEESVQANLCERRLNDQLLADEACGKVAICRAPAFVGCVSNFSNFLDLSRKTLRNIELGVPVVILSRSNTTQHMFRWTELLVELMDKHGVDNSLVTYAAAELPEQQRMLRSSPESAMYITSSREIAQAVRELHPNVMSSTGGPNTLVAPAMNKEIRDAIQLSAMIENSGQCTALRHACVGGATEEDMQAMFADFPTVATPQDALRNGAFAGVFNEQKQAPFTELPGYTVLGAAANSKLAYRLGSELPEDGISEQWRQTYVDMTSVSTADFGSEAQVAELAKWLVRNQPISLAMNTVGGDLSYARQLFEQTSQVVYTVGREGNPALTCQARPQEGEVFGEFPVRRDLAKYTRYPVIVPSPTPAYNCHYEKGYLAAQADTAARNSGIARGIVDRISSSVVRGFCAEVASYLADATGAHRGDGKNTGGPDRTILYGLQRPPLNGLDTVLRCGPETTLDELAPTLVPFYATNAWEGTRISCDPSNGPMQEHLKELGIEVTLETNDEFDRAVETEELYNVVRPEALADNNNTGELEKFPMVGQFVSLYFPCGHVKSTTHDDEDFVDFFKQSPKWLKMRS